MYQSRYLSEGYGDIHCSNLVDIIMEALTTGGCYVMLFNTIQCITVSYR